MELTKRMYGTEINSIRGPFGLRSGQMSGGGGKIQHNAGWFNRQGQLLGWGDMGPSDFTAIAAELPQDEVFVVLDEEAWRFNGKEDYEEQGTDHVVAHADMIVRNGRCYIVDRHWDRHDSRWQTVRGIRFRFINREAARQIILFG